ncbi:MAG: response regulator [Pyrinomonadaceae bacterium]
MAAEVVAVGDRADAAGREDLEDFDLIISDLTDDAEGGMQIISELQRKRLIVPVVISSENAQHHGIIKAFKMGAANFVRRPYERDELRNIIEKALSYKLRFVEDLKVLPFVHEKD